MPPQLNAQEIEQLIKDAIHTRELGQPDLATSQFTSAIDEAKKLEQPDRLIASALGGRILCHKHNYKNTGESQYLDEMAADITEGKKLDVPDAVTSVFYLRESDLELLKVDYLAAEVACEKACTMLGDKPSSTRGEYLGHLAEIKTKLGKTAKAIELASMGLHQVRHYGEDLEPFHRDVIVCGLQGRRSQAAFADRDYFLALPSLALCYFLAWRLWLLYGYGQLLSQFHQELRKKLGSP